MTGAVLYRPPVRDERLDISLVLCTRNRVGALQESLTALAAAVAATPAISIEIVLVDSASTDATPALLETWARQQPFPVIAVQTTLPGLARARNRGLAEARGDIIAMTDDDCLVAPDYFSKLKAFFDRASGPVVVGGRIDLGDPRDLPITIKPDPVAAVARPNRIPVGFIMGANLAFDRRAWLKLGLFDERFGAGAPFVSAEDTDFLVRALKAGVPVQYEPSIVVRHFHGRRLVDDARKLSAGYSFGDGALFAKHALTTPFIVRAMAGAVVRTALDLVKPSHDPIIGKRKHLFRLRHQWLGFQAFLAAKQKGAQIEHS